ncbi:MAG: hypothetical protein F9K44_07620 [Hyphomicrobiaceae bacterium]|nr:MAG: hypothetical protein F9K44_07620 [Hyphomicrobiaceae bacterium]
MGRRILWTIVGFIAGALAVATFHQAIIWGLSVTTDFKPASPPWSIDNVKWTVPGWKTVEVPHLVNLMFWGGVWGAPFGFLFGGLGRPLLPIMGIIFGIIGPMMIGGWGLVPYLNGQSMFPVRYEANTLTFYGQDGKKLTEPKSIDDARKQHLIRAGLEGGWGFGTGLFLALLRGRNRSRS